MNTLVSLITHRLWAMLQRRSECEVAAPASCVSPCSTTAAAWLQTLTNIGSLFLRGHRYQTCLRLDNIPQERITDPAFLALLFNLRKETGDESHIAQILYDVLLPWLVDKPIMLALEEQRPDPCAEFRTAQRSKSSGYFCVLEAIRYMLRRKGVSRPQLKQLTYALRREMLTKVKDDLEAISDPAARWRNILDLVANKQLVNRSGQSVAGNSALRGKTVALYFSAHWCPPCRGFTPTLVQTYSALKQQNRDLEVVFISSDRDQAGFNEYLGQMPWLVRQTRVALQCSSVLVLLLFFKMRCSLATGATIFRSGD
eukprot:SAG31_NODE_6156_length_2145_cov_2.099218_3_plen_313_part_00